MTYDEAVAKREQWARGAIAEYAGLVDAKLYGAGVRYYPDPYEQSRYDKAIQEAKDIMSVNAVKVSA